VRDAVGSVESDGSVVERYRVAYDYARYGREEFAIAREASSKKPSTSWGP
jgi:hypothetical protein